MRGVVRSAQAGLAEKNDVLITIEPRETGAGVKIDVRSPSLLEFGRHISETVRDVVRELSIDDVSVLVEDKGALDFTIRARCETALRRSLKE